MAFGHSPSSRWATSSRARSTASKVPAPRRAVRNCSLIPPAVAYSSARLPKSTPVASGSVPDRPPKTAATYRVASVGGNALVDEPPADRVQVRQVGRDRAGGRGQRVERALVVDGDHAAERVEDRAGEVVPWVDRGNPHAPGDGGQRNRAHDDLRRPHQRAERRDRNAGHDADDRLLCAEGQVREGGRGVLGSHAQEHDVRALDDGLVAVDDVDGRIASGEPARPLGASRGQVEGARGLLAFAEAGDDRLGDCADADDAEVPRGHSLSRAAARSGSRPGPTGSGRSWSGRTRAGSRPRSRARTRCP